MFNHSEVVYVPRSRFSPTKGGGKVIECGDMKIITKIQNTQTYT